RQVDGHVLFRDLRGDDRCGAALAATAPASAAAPARASRRRIPPARRYREAGPGEREQRGRENREGAGASASEHVRLQSTERIPGRAIRYLRGRCHLMSL